MYEKVLIAVDGSDIGEEVARNGLDVAEQFGSEVHVIYVVETKATYLITVGLSDEKMEQYEAYGEEVVSDVVAQANERGLDATGVVKKGNIANQVVQYANDEDVDGIFVGEQGHDPVKKYLGSNTEKIVRQSSKPVTIIRG